jgi:hypothetical protein
LIQSTACKNAELGARGERLKSNENFLWSG